ncbi:hypothetical protein BY458DRAFT_310076 [Sporodiniella umbellata]|nr:hypothetical protein BY458DRAFT_310076 [Sporodiniella umbellata]
MAYEEHYEAKHTHVCLTCNKVFPGSLWLKLHIDEIHNTIFLIRKERGEKIHACYVESCSKFFSTPKMRRLHLIHKHKYPTHFPFDLVFTGTLSFQQLKKRDQNNKRRLKKLKGDIDMDRLHISKKNNVKDIEMDLSHHSEESITKEVGMNRNRYKEGNIVNMDQPRDPEESKTQEVEMSELTDAFERKLKIPKSISFGKHVNRSLLLSSKEKKKKPQQ